MSARTDTYDLQATLARRGILVTVEQANTLRRAQLTLRRWFEQECGDSNNYASFSIERDEQTDKPYRCVYLHQGNYGWSVWCLPDFGEGTVKIRATSKDFCDKSRALEYMQTISPSREPEVRQVLSRRYPIADREAGAKRRVEQIAQELGLHVYYQGDPRGPSLYVSKEPFPPFDSSRGAPCC